MWDKLKRQKDFWLEVIGIDKPRPLVDLEETKREFEVVDYSARDWILPTGKDRGLVVEHVPSYNMKQVVSATRERVGKYITYTFKLGRGDDTHDR